MGFFKKKELTINTPIEAYKFTPGGLYIIEVKENAVTRKQMDEVMRSASIYDIRIKVVYTTGDMVGIYPVRSNG